MIPLQANTESQAIRFPALSFSQGIVYAIQSLEPVSRCTRLGFKKGFYEGMVIVDSCGSLFRVLQARRIRTVAKSMFEVVELLTGNPHWQVELIFAPRPSIVSMDEVKKLIFDSFVKQKHTWEAMSDFQDFRDQVEASSSFEQIFSAFKRFGVS